VKRVDFCRLALQSDLETFSNPHTDRWILPRSPELNVNMVFTGIDIEMPEIFLGDRLNGKHAVAVAAGACLQGMACRQSLFLFTTACPG